MRLKSFKTFSENEFIACIIGFVGFIALIIYQITLGSLNLFFVYIFSFLICHVFFLKLFMDYLISKTRNRAMAFSISWSSILLISLFMGGIGLKFPFWVIIFIGQFLLLLSALRVISETNLTSILPILRKSFIAVFVGIIFFGISLVYSLPWLSAISKAGVGYHDTFRDAAIINMWSNYHSITHGVHGLLPEPYHALFAMFYSPHMTSSEDVFNLFVGFSLILVPALISYGLLNIFEANARSHTKTLKLPLLLLFLTTISCMDYIAGQRSLQISSLLLLGMIPAYIVVCSSKVQSQNAIILLAILLPILFFGRVFHGLIAIFVLAGLFFKVSLKSKLYILMSCIVCLIILLAYYADTPRAFESRAPLSFLETYMKRSIWNMSPYLYIFIICCIFIFPSFNKINQRQLIFFYKLRQPILLTCSGTLLLIFICHNFTDAFYQMIPGAWIVFAMLASSFMYFLSWQNNILTKKFIIKLLVIISVFSGCNLALNNGKKTVFKLLDHQHQLLNVYNFETKYEKRASAFGSKLSMPSSFYENYKGVQLLSSIKTIPKIINDAIYITELLPLSLPALMAKRAKLISNNLDGVSGLYIQPEHTYWSYPFNFQVMPSLYFQAKIGLPLLFGAKHDMKTTAFSIRTAQNFGGTLQSFDPVADSKLMCEAASKVRVDNILVFEVGSLNPNVIVCATYLKS